MTISEKFSFMASAARYRGAATRARAGAGCAQPVAEIATRLLGAIESLILPCVELNVSPRKPA